MFERLKCSILLINPHRRSASLLSLLGLVLRSVCGAEGRISQLLIGNINGRFLMWEIRDLTIPNLKRTIHDGCLACERCEI